MINKYAGIGEDTSFYSPSIKELHHAQTNSKGVANLITAALGLSLAGYSAKTLFENIAQSRISNDIQPSIAIQRKLRDATSPISNEFLYNTKALQHPYATELDAEIARLEKEKKEKEKKGKKKEKKAMYKQADPIITIQPSIFGPDDSGKLKQSPAENIFANRSKATFAGPLVKVDANKVLSNADTTLSDRLHYDPSSLKTDSFWTKHISAPLAKLGPQSAIPLAIAAGGGIVVAPVLAKLLVKGVKKLFPAPKRHSSFVDKAKKIYEEAAKELQEVGYKKEKDKNREKHAEAKDKTKSVISVTANPGNPLLSASNLPALAIASLLGYATYKGVKGFTKGMNKAKDDISHQTQLLRGWRASNQLRNYSYNPLTAELEEEPGLKTRLLREKDKQIKALLEDIKDADGVEVNPFEIHRLLHEKD